MHDGDGYTLHLSDSEIGDDPMGGVGSADGYMVAFLETEGSEIARHAANLGVHLAIGIVVATRGVLGSAVFSEVEIGESRLVPIIADDLSEDVKIIACHDFSK